MSGDAYIAIGADTADFTAAMASAQTALKDLLQQVQGTAESLTPLSRAARQAVADLDPLTAGAQKSARQLAALNSAIVAGSLTGAQGIRALGTLTDRMKELGKGGEDAGHGLAQGEHQAGIFREKMVLLHEAVVGSTSRMAGSMMVLSERTGSLGGAFATLLTPTTLVAAAIAVTVGTVYKFVAAAEETERAALAIQTAFAAVGHGGMISRQGVDALATQLARLPGINREAADQIISDFARTRQIGGALFAALTAEIDQSARVLGVDAPEAAKKLAAAFADPTKGAKELDAQFNILTSSQLRQIETLQRLGDRIGAQNVLLTAWKARLGELPPGLTAIQSASNQLGTAWDKLLHSLGETSAFTAARQAVANFLTGLTWTIGGNDAIATLDQQIGAAQRRVRELQQAASARPTMGGRGNVQGQLDKARAELAELEARKAAEQRAADQAAAQAQRQTETDKHSQIADQRKADLADPSLIPQMEKVKGIDEDIARLERDKDGASAEEIRRLNERIALKQKERADLLKPDKPTGAPTQMEQWQAELAQKQEALARDHAAEANYHSQALAQEAAFWEAKAKLARAGSKERVEAEKAAHEAEKRLAEQQAQEARQAAKEQRDIARQDVPFDVEIAKIGL